MVCWDCLLDTRRKGANYSFYITLCGYIGWRYVSPGLLSDMEHAVIPQFVLPTRGHSQPNMLSPCTVFSAVSRCPKRSDEPQWRVLTPSQALGQVCERREKPHPSLFPRTPRNQSHRLPFLGPWTWEEVRGNRLEPLVHRMSDGEKWAAFPEKFRVSHASPAHATWPSNCSPWKPSPAAGRDCSNGWQAGQPEGSDLAQSAFSFSATF